MPFWTFASGLPAGGATGVAFVSAGAGADAWRSDRDEGRSGRKRRTGARRCAGSAATGARGQVVSVRCQSMASAMDIEFAGVVHRPVHGEELHIPAHTTHSARSVGTTTSRWLYGYRKR